MSFMQPQVVFDEWWKVETDHGITFIPADVVGDIAKPIHFLDYIEGDKPPAPDAYEKINGYGARLSAPGYLDCTQWAVFDSEDEARKYLMETYDECEFCNELCNATVICSSCSLRGCEECMPAGKGCMCPTCEEKS